MRLICFAGTRPECLKLAPLARLAAADERFALALVSSGQHPHMVAATLAHLNLTLAASLPAIPPASMLSKSVTHMRSHARRWLEQERPDAVLVQGDTSTAYACALAANDCRLPLAHLEAGLRTSDPMRPFPEEPFRRRITPLALWHFAPTPRAAANLLDEGVNPAAIHVVGNSIVDLLRETLAGPLPQVIPWSAHGRRLVVMTLHRRENYQHGLLNICNAMLDLLAQHEELCLVCPVHPNPVVGTRIRRLLAVHPRVLLTPPLPYRTFIALLREASLVVSDSGGIQEEAGYLGTPLLVTRSETERPEATLNGVVQLVGSKRDSLLQACMERLHAARPPACAFDAQAPFGDGQTAARVLHTLLKHKETAA